VTVENVVPQDDTVQIRGRYRSIDGGLNGRTSIWLTDGCSFSLTKSCWSQEAIQALKQRSCPASAPQITARPEEKAVDQFRDLIATDSDLIAFGDSVFWAVDAGAAKTLLCTASSLVKQPKDRQNTLTKCGGQFRGADVFILNQSSEFYHEIQTYGGAVAILAYRFNPEDCLI
jgi:stalled ribosome rescue protein Dom34